MTRRVAVVGLGCVSPAGSDPQAHWRALLAGRAALGPLEGFDLDGFPVHVAGSITDRFASYCPPCPWKERLAGDETRRNARLLGAAVAQAATSCGWLNPGGALAAAPGNAAPERSGLYGALREERDPGQGAEEPWRVLLELAGDLRALGPQLVLHDTCATGTTLLGEAFHDLRQGAADVALVAAANADLRLEMLCHLVVQSLVSRSNAPDASLPFDVRRDGFVRSEGSAAVVLRAWEDGREPVPTDALAEVIGYGASADAHRPTAGHPEQRGLVLALRRCLDDAGAAPGDVDHLCAAGAGTPFSDLHEARAYHHVFGELAARIPLTAHKSVVGHTSFAAGLIEAVGAVLTLREGTIPPTAHLSHFDPELPSLDVVVDEPRPSRPRTVLCLGSGLGGVNAALLLRRVDPGSGPPPLREVR